MYHELVAILGVGRQNKITCYIAKLHHTHSPQHQQQQLLLIDVLSHFTIYKFLYLEEETEDFASKMFSPGLLVVHNTARGG